MEVRVPQKGANFSSFEVLGSSITSNIEIYANLIQGEKVNLVVLYGTQSESRILTSSDKKFSSILLCHDSTDKFDR